MSGWSRAARADRSRKPRGCPATPARSSPRNGASPPPVRSPIRTSRRSIAAQPSACWWSAPRSARPGEAPDWSRAVRSCAAATRRSPTAAPGSPSASRIKLGRDTFTVVGLTENLVASGGDPVVFVTLRDAQKLQFDLTPAAARREAARTPGVDRLDRYGQCRSGAAAAGRRCDAIRADHRALEASLRAHPGGAGERAGALGDRARAPPDRPVHQPAADRFDRDHRPHHLHDDDRQEEIDRHAQADRRARPHDRRPDRAAGHRLWA